MSDHIPNLVAIRDEFGDDPDRKLAAQIAVSSIAFMVDLGCCDDCISKAEDAHRPILPSGYRRPGTA